MFDSFLFFCFPSKSKLKCEENDPQKPLLILNDDDDYESVVQLQNPTTAMAVLLRSWLNGRRLRYLILALCLPLIIPIVFVSFPVICAVEICFRFCRKKRCRLKSGSGPTTSYDVEGGGGGGGGQVAVVVELNLLERYLDDQLGLALEFTCEFDSCEEEDDDDYKTDDFYRNRRNLLC